MLLISHRGNLRGPDVATENLPAQVDKCLGLGIDCEVDLRYSAAGLYLGHDRCQYQIELDWLVDRAKVLWIHCKDSESLFHLKQSKVNLNYFWHNEDKHTLTSKGYIWTFPGAPLSDDSIAVLPENWWNPPLESNLGLSLGICTDFPLKFREDLGLD